MSNKKNIEFNFDEASPEKSAFKKRVIKYTFIGIVIFSLFVYGLYILFIVEDEIKFENKTLSKLIKIYEPAEKGEDFFSGSVSSEVIESFSKNWGVVNVFQSYKKRTVKPKKKNKIVDKVEKVEEKVEVENYGFKLNGIVQIGKTRYAVIENDFYKIGQTVDDYAVVEITTTEVVLFSEINDEELTLKHVPESNYGVHTNINKFNKIKKSIKKRLMK